MSTLSSVNFYKVNAMSGFTGLVPNSLYFELLNGKVNTYLTDTAGNAKPLINLDEVNTAITTKLSDQNLIEIVADLTARDALVASAQKNMLILVVDAAPDPLVVSGSALYAYSEATTSFSILSKYESVELSLVWSNISGKPNSTPSQIDQAVTDSHTHSNKSSLDLVGQTASGTISYNGEPVVRWESSNW